MQQRRVLTKISGRLYKMLGLSTGIWNGSKLQYFFHDQVEQRDPHHFASTQAVGHLQMEHFGRGKLIDVGDHLLKICESLTPRLRRKLIKVISPQIHTDLHRFFVISIKSV